MLATYISADIGTLLMGLLANNLSRFIDRKNLIKIFILKYHVRHI